LRDINFALTSGLQTAIAMLDNYERLTEEQRRLLINQLKELVEVSRKAYAPEPQKED